MPDTRRVHSPDHRDPSRTYCGLAVQPVQQWSPLGRTAKAARRAPRLEGPFGEPAMDCYKCLDMGAGAQDDHGV